MAANVQTTSITSKKSLEVTGMCSDGCSNMEDEPAVSGGAGAVGDGTGGDESGTEVHSTSTTGTGCSSLGRSFA